MLIHDEPESSIHIDFVPLADVLFNLLIFFLLATTIAQVEREMRISLPETSFAAPISAALREIVINVDPSGTIIVAGKPTDDETLSRLLRDALAANKSQRVSVRADRAAAYAAVAHALDLCKGAGITEPFLDTIPAR